MRSGGASIAIEIVVEIDIPSMQENFHYDAGARPLVRPSRPTDCGVETGRDSVRPR